MYALLSLQREEQESHVNTEIQLFGAYPICLNELQVFQGKGLLFFFMDDNGLEIISLFTFPSRPIQK